MSGKELWLRGVILQSFGAGKLQGFRAVEAFWLLGDVGLRLRTYIGLRGRRFRAQGLGLRV